MYRANIGTFAQIMKRNQMEDTKHIKISEYNYPLPDERIAKFPLAVRDQSKLLVYRHGEVSEDTFTALPEYLEQGELMIFNNTKVIQARLHFRKETGALIEVFCLEPIQPNDYVLSFQQTKKCSWLCMIGNLKKWKEGALSRMVDVKGKQVTLTATRGECRGTSHWVDFEWNDDSITFADLLEVVGELPIPPYLNRDTQESDKETYQTVYSKIKGSVAAPTAGLHFTERVLQALDAHGIDREELTLHVGAGTFKPVKSEEIEGHEMHTEYISVNKRTIEKLIAHGGHAHCRRNHFGENLGKPVLYRSSYQPQSRCQPGRTARAAMDALRREKWHRHYTGFTAYTRLSEPSPHGNIAHQYANHHCSGLRIQDSEKDGYQFPPTAKHITAIGFCFCERRLAKDL